MTNNQASAVVVSTVGHSTRSLADLIALLRRHGVVTLVDVRTIPRSRHTPQFNRELLAVELPGAGIRYVHLPRLGGLRQGLGKASPNTAWRNPSFRGFADYMLTPDFEAGLNELLELAKEGPVAIMCAEAVPWRCHRSLIADALVARGVPVRHLLGANRADPHRLTPFARVEGQRVSYPTPAGESGQGEASEEGGRVPRP